MAQEIKRVVIIGGGFAGLRAARALKGAPVEIIIIDRHNYHVFQPLLYQVATAGLSPADIAAPIRGVVGSQPNTRVLLGQAESIDRENKRVMLAEGSVDYDYLIVATGMRNNYFGQDAWELHAPGLKTIEEALDIRRSMLLAFEAAEYEEDPEEVKRLMTFVIIGGGPTGVEMAGAYSEIATEVIRHDFRNIDPRHTRIILIELRDALLAAMSEHSQQHALKALRRRGVEVVFNTLVKEITEEGVQTEDEFIPTANIVWAAGLKAEPLIASLGVEQDRGGRAKINADLTIADDPFVYVLGDTAHFDHDDHGQLPGLAPVAIQQGEHAAKNIQRHLKGQALEPFKYLDKGAMATIGRTDAVAEAGPFKLKGFIAWLAWLFIHLLFLIGFRSKVSVLVNWAYSYLAFRRSTRLIVGVDQTSLGRALLAHAPADLRASAAFDETMLRVSGQHAALSLSQLARREEE